MALPASHAAPPPKRRARHQSRIERRSVFLTRLVLCHTDQSACRTEDRWDRRNPRGLARFTHAPNSLGLSCPAAQATPLSLYGNSAGNTSSNSRYASRVSRGYTNTSVKPTSHSLRSHYTVFRPDPRQTGAFGGGCASAPMIMLPRIDRRIEIEYNPCQRGLVFAAGHGVVPEAAHPVVDHAFE